MSERASFTPEEVMKEKPVGTIIEIGRQDILNLARDEGEERLEKHLEKQSGIKKVFSEIWEGDIARELYLTGEIDKIHHDVLETGKENIYAGETDDRTHHEKAKETIFERFTAKHDKYIHENAGEKKRELSDEGEEKVLKQDIQELVREYAIGFIDKKVFMQRKSAILGQTKNVQGESLEKGALYLDNLFQIAEQYKSAVEHGQKLHELDLDFDVNMGKAKLAVRTESQFTAVDWLLEKTLNTKIGRYVNEYALAGAISLAYCVAAKLSKDVANSKLAAVGSLGATVLGSSFLAGGKELRKYQEKRKQYLRDRAKGKKFDPKTAPPVEKELEEFNYDMREANTFSEALESCTKVDQEGELTPENFILGLSALVEADARIDLSDSHHKDLIKYFKNTNSEPESLRLDKARLEASTQLEKYFSENKTKIFEYVGLEPGTNIDDFNTYYQKMRETIKLKLIEGADGIKEKDLLFQKMLRKKVASAVIRGFVSGLLIGGLSQELSSAVGQLKPVEYVIQLFSGKSVEGVAVAATAAAAAVGEGTLGVVTDLGGDKASDAINHPKNSSPAL